MRFNALVMVGGLALTALSLQVSTAYQPSKKAKGVLLVYHGDRSEHGTPLLQPMVPAEFGIQVVAGEPPTKGKSYRCSVENVKIAKFNTKDGPTEFNRLTLVCGKSVFAVKEIVFQ